MGDLAVAAVQEAAAVAVLAAADSAENSTQAHQNV